MNLNLKPLEKRLLDLERASLGPDVRFADFLAWWRGLPPHDLGVYWEQYAAGIGDFLPRGVDVAGHVDQVRQRRAAALETLVEFSKEIEDV